jgi:hypothetical protein
MATATVAAAAIRQFQLDVPERDLDELRRRMWATRGHTRKPSATGPRASSWRRRVGSVATLFWRSSREVQTTA